MGRPTRKGRKSKSHDSDSHRNKALHASPRTTFSKARVFGDRATYKFKTKSLLISEREQFICETLCSTNFLCETSVR